MCLALLAVGMLPELPLLIVANRDELHARPALPAAPWPERPDIYAGRDLQGGGTWLGVTRSGRYALLTNYRDPAHVMMGAPTRGALVEDFLTSTLSPAAYAVQVHAQGARYNGFNLIVGERHAAVYCSNRDGAPRPLAPGVYGLSNALLDTPWPKLVRTRDALARLLQAGQAPDEPTLLGLMADRQSASDTLLPDTGIGLVRERLLGSPFIVSPVYGTRCTTVLQMDAQAHVRMTEVSFAPDGTRAGCAQWKFALDPVASHPRRMAG